MNWEADFEPYVVVPKNVPEYDESLWALAGTRCPTYWSSMLRSKSSFLRSFDLHIVLKVCLHVTNIAGQKNSPLNYFGLENRISGEMGSTPLYLSKSPSLLIQC